MQQTFLSRTRSRKRYRFGKQEATLRQAPRWQFLLADRPAGQAIRALAWLGPDQADAALPKVRKNLPQQDWDALLAVRAELPIWLVELLNEANGFAGVQAPGLADRHKPSQSPSLDKIRSSLGVAHPSAPQASFAGGTARPGRRVAGGHARATAARPDQRGRAISPLG